MTFAESVYALSSSCPDAQPTPAICEALLKNATRCARAYSLPAPRVEFASRIGAIDDPNAVDVHWVPDWSGPEFAGQDLSDAIAFHTIMNGRRVIYVSWAAVQVNGGTLTGPDGLVSATSHEINEDQCDPLIPAPILVTNPQGQREPREVADRLQGNDYCEQGSDGIYVSDALIPSGWDTATPANDVVNIAADVDPSKAVRGPFPLLPGGYYEPLDEVPVFGERASARLVARVSRRGARSGAVRAALR